MISTVMAEYFVLTRVILLVGFVAAVITAGLLARRAERGRRIATGITIASVILVLALTFSPDPTGVQESVVCNLTPHSFATDVLNMALFLLPALFAVVASRRPLVVALVVPLASAVIEVVQLAIPDFGRRCDVDDWLANVIGGIAGVLIALAVMWVARRRDTAAG